MTDEPLAKKSLGQHWLNDPATLQYICDAGEVSEGDNVLEIGPGTGTLTQVLLDAGASVTAVEYDKSLASELNSKFAGQKFKLIESDILRFDFGTLPPGYKVVANIPYYLTSNLIRVLSETPNRASTVVLLVQKEVAERVAAIPGQMSLLSVSAQFYWHVGLGEIVPAKLFTPPPKVNSRVITLDKRAQPLFTDIDTKQFFRLVKAGFASRRKTLLNSLAGGLRTDKEQIKNVLIKAEISPGLRAQALSLDNWNSLYISCVTSNVI